MSLCLYVDGDRWRAHLRAVVDAHPGIVPVAKGNGYGFGVGSLARRGAWLGADLMAVGTYDEAGEVLTRFDGDVLVLTPYRPFMQARQDRRLIHTVGRLEDLAALREAAAAHPPAGRPRVLLEGLTAMRRHGLTAEQVRAADTSGVSVEGLALHLPMDGDRVAETTRWLAAGLHDLVFVSHLTDGELATLSERFGDVRLRPRIGTALWLGNRAALSARATVLDIHPVAAGDRVGYRQRRVPRRGNLVVVSGGTAHGIGLEAPTAATSVRSRAVTLARGGLDAAGFALSPFRVDGRQRWFVEPPQMQVSMLFVPDGTALPTIGAELDLDVRFTTTTFDRVTIS
ncbi:MAG: alanine racemase [Nocardioidaceae bacterium]